MKKIIALFVAMAFFSTTVFAAPLSLAGSLGTQPNEFALAGQLSVGGHDGFGDLFADVDAVALTQEEAQAVEGEGSIGVAILSTALGAAGGFLGGLAGGAIQQNAINNRPIAVKVAVVTGTIVGGAIGAGFGVKVGAFLPF